VFIRIIRFPSWDSNMPHHVKIGTIVGMLSRTLQLTTLRPQFVKECVYILRLFHSDREYSLTALRAGVYKFVQRFIVASERSRVAADILDGFKDATRPPAPGAGRPPAAEPSSSTSSSSSSSSPSSSPRSGAHGPLPDPAGLSAPQPPSRNAAHGRYHRSGRVFVARPNVFISVRPTPIHVTNHVENQVATPVVNVQPPQLTIENRNEVRAPDVSVNNLVQTPAIHVQTPNVHVTNHVQTPEVRVENHNQVPTPNVQITNNVPVPAVHNEVRAPDVNISVPVPAVHNAVQPPAVYVDSHNELRAPEVHVTVPTPVVNNLVQTPTVYVNNQVPSPEVNVTNNVAAPVVQNDVHVPQLTVNNHIEPSAPVVQVAVQPAAVTPTINVQPTPGTYGLRSTAWNERRR
jgi:hypothetical protein